jgi:hypothetical protein
MRPVRVVVPAVVIVAVSVYLSHNVVEQWGQAIGFGQRAATLTQAAYGVLGVLAGIAALWRARALGWLLGLWVLALTATGVLAPVVYGGQPWLTGILGGLVSGTIATLLAWWCLAASAASLWEGATRRELADRLRRLTPEARALWGKMNCPQMLTHVNDQLRMSMGELPAPLVRLPVRFPPLKQLVVYTLPWPKGLPTSPALIARLDQSAWPTEVASFSELLDRFAARPSDATWPMHPAFGALSRRAWGVLGYRHVDHHFRQFGV